MNSPKDTDQRAVEEPETYEPFVAASSDVEVATAHVSESSCFHCGQSPDTCTCPYGFIGKSSSPEGGAQPYDALTPPFDPPTNKSLDLKVAAFIEDARILGNVPRTQGHKSVRDDFVNYDGERTNYESFFFPNLGNVTVTYESNPGANLDVDAHVTISIDFPLSKLDIVDRSGNTRKILPSD